MLGADEDFNAEIKLTYIVSIANIYTCRFTDYSLSVVSNATWEPTYELHATTENGKPSNSVALHYRARVTQSTGEDWNNTLLALSTVTRTTTNAIPNSRAQAPPFEGTSCFQ